MVPSSAFDKCTTICRLTGVSSLDTPPWFSARGCAVQRRGYRHASPNGLSARPLSLLGGVVVAVEARPALRAGVRADRHASSSDDAAPRTRLARERGIDKIGLEPAASRRVLT